MTNHGQLFAISFPNGGDILLDVSTSKRSMETSGLDINLKIKYEAYKLAYQYSFEGEIIANRLLELCQP